MVQTVGVDSARAPAGNRRPAATIVRRRTGESLPAAFTWAAARHAAAAMGDQESRISITELSSGCAGPQQIPPEACGARTGIGVVE
jgi:hypothetical protein